MEQQEAVAGFRILVGVARADGHLTTEEHHALESALGDGEANRAFLEELLKADIDIDFEIARLTNEQRRRVYEAAYLIAHADGTASPEEVALLERIFPNDGEPTFVGQVLGETKDTLLPTDIAPIADPDQRKLEVQEDTLKYSVLCAVLGAMPVPGVSILTDLVVVGLQVKLVRDIGHYYGHRTDEAAIKSMLSGVVGSTGLRIGLNSLAKFVPGWGSLFGAVTSFATTFAVGRMADAWFASGQAMDMDQLRATFQSARKEGQKVYEEKKGDIDAAAQAHAAKLTQLNEDMSAGRISREDYEAQIAALKKG